MREAWNQKEVAHYRDMTHEWRTKKKMPDFIREDTWQNGRGIERPRVSRQLSKGDGKLPF